MYNDETLFVICIQLGYAFCINQEIFNCFMINCFMSIIVISYSISLTFVEPKILNLFYSIIDKCCIIRIFFKTDLMYHVFYISNIFLLIVRFLENSGPLPFFVVFIKIYIFKQQIYFD